MIQLSGMLSAAGIKNAPPCWAQFFDEAMAGYAPPGALSDDDFFCVPEDERLRARTLMERVMADEALSRLLFLLRFIAMERTTQWAQWGDWPTPGEDAGGDWFYVLTLLSNMHNLRRACRERGIPDNIMADTLSDLPRYIYETRRFSGRDGIAGVPFWWMTLHFSARIFRLGRLQFEPTTLGEPVNLPGGQAFPAETPVLSAHIPAGSPLTPASFRASFEAAKPFFKKHFPEREFAAVICASWLLEPALEGLLPEDSNILKFQRAFTHVRMQNVDHSVYKHVFGCNYTENPDALAEQTSLQRGLKAFLTGGNEIRAALGVMPL